GRLGFRYSLLLPSRISSTIAFLIPRLVLGGSNAFDRCDCAIYAATGQCHREAPRLVAWAKHLAVIVAQAKGPTSCRCEGGNSPYSTGCPISRNRWASAILTVAPKRGDDRVGPVWRLYCERRARCRRKNESQLRTRYPIQKAVIQPATIIIQGVAR